MVFLANPNNPTGTYLPFAEVERLAARLPSHVLLVLDAAYAEYVTRADYSAGAELVSTSDNVVMTRTFSKIYGLAGIRLGWCYAPLAVCDAINRIRGPFNTNGAAIAAGVAALEDHGHIEKAIAHNETWRAWLAQEISALGIKITPSVGNFLLLAFQRRDAGAGGGPLSLEPGPDPARGRRLWAAALPAAHRRHRGGEPSRCRGPQGFHRVSRAARVPDGLGAPLSEPLFQRLALIGMGLIGSSLARVCRRKALAREIIAADISAGVRAKVAELALADRGRRDSGGRGRGGRSRHPLRARRRDGDDRAGDRARI